MAGKKRVILELGGNAACIVDAGADLKWAATGPPSAPLPTPGQVCIAVQRLLVMAEVYEEFKKIFLETVAREIKAGDPARADTVALMLPEPGRFCGIIVGAPGM